MDFMGLSTSFHSEKSFPSVCSVFPAVKHVFYSMFFCPYGCVCASLCRGWPGKKLAKRLVFTLKGCTFALAFGKQGRQGRCGSGAVDERVH